MYLIREVLLIIFVKMKGRFELKFRVIMINELLI